MPFIQRYYSVVDHCYKQLINGHWECVTEEIIRYETQCLLEEGGEQYTDTERNDAGPSYTSNSDIRTDYSIPLSAQTGGASEVRGTAWRLIN